MDYLFYQKQKIEFILACCARLLNVLLSVSPAA